MNPIEFPEANTIFGPPKELSESQCLRICAYVGEVKQGSVDGVGIAVVAWQPDARDINRIINGHPIFLTTLGGLPPHFLSTDFNSAINPA